MSKNKVIDIYRLKVSLVGYHKQPISKLHRIIDASSNTTFHDLHQVIFEAFDRFDEHLYQFFLSRSEVKNVNNLFDCREIVAMPSEMDYPDSSGFGGNKQVYDSFQFKLADAKLSEKQFFYYWFDFGDDWFHRIRIEKVTPIELDFDVNEQFICEVMKKVGVSPPQYNDDSVWEGGSDEAEFERVVMSVLTLKRADEIPGGVTWAMLEEIGVTQILLDKGFIEKPKKPNDCVELTEFGLIFADMVKQAAQGDMSWEK